MSTRVFIRRSDLERADACSAGMDLFHSVLRQRNEHRVSRGLKARSFLSWPDTPLHSIWLAKTYPEFWDFLVCEDMVKNIDVSYACFAGIDLSGARLPRARFYDCDFSGADLRGANLIGADLRRSTFPRADLRRADLWSATLPECSFDGADLEGALVDADPRIAGWRRNHYTTTLVRE